jgi:hypothetical protein
MTTRKGLSAGDRPGVLDTSNRAYSKSYPTAVTNQPGPPTSPKDGELWYDNDDPTNPAKLGALKVWNATTSAWEYASSAELPATPSNPTTVFLDGNRTWQPSTRYPLSAAPDAAINAPTTGQILRYDSTNTSWNNVAPTPAALGLQASFDAKESLIAAGTASQFYRGDKTWQPINGFNLIQNPGFEDTSGGSQTQTPHWTNLQLSNSAIPRSGAGAAHFRATSAVVANTDVVVANGPASSLTSHPRCQVGETYRAEFWMRNGATTPPSTSPALRAFIRVMDNNGAVVESAVGTSILITATYTLYSVELTITNVAAFYIIAGVNAPNGLIVDDAWRVDDMALRWVPPISTAQQTALDAKANLPIFNRLTAAVSNSTVTYASAGMTINLAVGTYTVKVRGQYQSASTTVGIGIRLGGTSVTSAVAAEALIAGGTNSTTAPWFSRTMTGLVQAVAATTGVQAANTPTPFSIDGFLIVTTAGNLSVDLVSQTAGTAVQLNANTSIVAQKIA